MDDQLDKDIKNRIREVFDNYDDPTADEGWLLLREKFPEEKAKRRAIAWIWWPAAALLLLFLGIGLWEVEKTTSPDQITIIKKYPEVLHQNAIVQKSHSGNTNSVQTVKVKSENRNAAENIAKNNDKYLKQAPGYSSIVEPTPKFNTVITAPVSKIAMPAHSTGNIIQGSVQPPANQLATTAQTNTTKQPANQSTPAVIKSITDTLKKDVLTVNKPAAPKKSIESMFAEDKQPEDKTINGEKKVNFGVYAATYFNYAKGSGNQANLGAGVTSEITLTKNLKLVTGITVSQNTLAFNNSTPVAGTQSASFSAASSGIAAGTAPGANLSPMALFSIGEINTASTPTYKDYSASLVGLEIPVNLKYEFNPKKTDFYVLAGFSSGTFINETYTYQYNYPALASPALQQVKDATAHSSFNSFYVGKMLNLALGVGYPLGRNRIILEPFLKYPLQGLGAQDIKFGAGGVNLKFNFTTNKK